MLSLFIWKVGSLFSAGTEIFLNQHQSAFTLPSSCVSVPMLTTTRLKLIPSLCDCELESIYWLVMSVFEYPASSFKFSNLKRPSGVFLGPEIISMQTLGCTFPSAGAFLLLPLPLRSLGTLSDGVLARERFDDGSTHHIPYT